MMKRKVWIVLAVLLALCAVVAVVYMVSGCGASRSVASRPEASRSVASRSVSSDSGVAASAAPTPALSQPWLELPSAGKNPDAMMSWPEGSPENDDDMHCVTHWAMMQGRMQRNYTCFYDEDTFTSYWVAYPLCHAHMTTGREEIWGYDDKVPEELQTNVKKGYGASVPTENYPKNFYARGHQIPNADRNAVPQMQAQTYYSTNMTPQIQNGFNGALWAKLEEAVRNETPAGDTLYVVTGASFRVKGDEAVKTIVNANDGKSLPVPNYYWKAVLKVSRTGGTLSDAVAVGFWVPHTDLKGRNYAEFAVSVDSIEALTGFDMFVNLPDALETIAESNSSWASFQQQ